MPNQPMPCGLPRNAGHKNWLGSQSEWQEQKKNKDPDASTTKNVIGTGLENSILGVMVASCSDCSVFV